LIFWKIENQRKQKFPYFENFGNPRAYPRLTFSNFKHEGSLLMMQPCKTLFIKTSKIWKMYKGIRKRKARIYRMLTQTRCQNLSMSKIDCMK